MAGSLAGAWLTAAELPVVSALGPEVRPPECDLAALGLRADERALTLRLTTRSGVLARRGGTYWFAIDAAGEDEHELVVAPLAADRAAVDWYDAAGRPQRREVPAVVAWTDHGLLCTLAWADLQQALPDELTQHPWRVDGRRPWLRVWSLSWLEGRGIVDTGPAVAVAMDAQWAPPSAVVAPPGGPAAPPAPLAMVMPVDGRWYVTQAAFGAFSHSGQWAVDLARRDRFHRAGPGDDAGRALADHAAFGAPVRAGVPGIVGLVVDGHPDNRPGERGERDHGNLVVVHGADGRAVAFHHLRQGSIRVVRGQPVGPATLLAEVGNSGASARPHLHISARAADGASIPIVFSDVVVGLNPGPDDPWRRNVASWHPRDGFFVEAVAAESGASP